MENAIEVLDRTVSSYTGGINTDEYYAKIYANEQNGVSTETLILDISAHGSVQGSAPSSRANSAPQQLPQNESPIDVFLRTTTSADGSQPVLPQHAQQQPPQTVPQDAVPRVSTPPQYQQGVGVPQKIEVTPTGAFGFVVSAAFSIAVVLSVIGVMFIVYIIIRTRQLHHHEHHVKELGGHGAPPTHAPEAKVHAPAAHVETHAEVPDVEHENADDETEGTRYNAHEEEKVEQDTEVSTEERANMEAYPVQAIPAGLAALSPAPPNPSLSSDEAVLFASRLKSIKTDAAGDDEDAWYTALMDINLLLEDVLGEKGYEGTSVKEMLTSDEAKELGTRDVGLEAEAQFQKLISGEESLTKDAIIMLVNMYAKVCKELGVV
jgi:hypothetical protein